MQKHLGSMAQRELAKRRAIRAGRNRRNAAADSKKKALVLISAAWVILIIIVLAATFIKGALTEAGGGWQSLTGTGPWDALGIRFKIPIGDQVSGNQGRGGGNQMDQDSKSGVAAAAATAVALESVAASAASVASAASAIVSFIQVQFGDIAGAAAYTVDHTKTSSSSSD